MDSCSLSHCCTGVQMLRTEMKRVEPRPPVTEDGTPATSGIVLHSPVLYDLTVWLAFLGKEDSFRQTVLNLARLKSGESVLDVGCGTGTLAVAAKRRVGAAGAVHGVDASVEMLARAE